MILAKSLGLDVQVKVQFKPIDSPSAESLATLNKLKADTDVALINAGVIDSQTANERVMNDPQSGYNADTALDPLEQQLADLVKNAAAAANGQDAEFKEGEHPRANNGQFGSGGNSGTILNGDELGKTADIKELRKAAQAHAQQAFVGKKFKNTDTGNDIEVTRQGVKHAIAGASDAELRIMPALKQILENGTHTETVPDKAGRTDIKAIHKYVSRVELGGESMNVGGIVRETKNGHMHYDHFIIR